MGYEDVYLSYKKAIDASLGAVNTRDFTEQMKQSFVYTQNAGGKRVRGVLCMAFASALSSQNSEAVVGFASAVEMIHTFSLIHDDLPCMDNDDMRRGLPTNHVVYGEALALLSGDALLARAFERMMAASVLHGDLKKAVTATAYIANAVVRMCGGQAMDMENEKSTPDLARVKLTAEKKTAALIKASCMAGALLGGADIKTLRMAERYGECVGLAFQASDDLLNAEGDAVQFGKPTGSDAARGKTTMYTLLGADGCRKYVEETTDKAVACVEKYPNNVFLVEFAKRLAGRAS